MASAAGQGRSHRRPTGDSAPSRRTASQVPRDAAVRGHRLEGVGGAGRVVAAHLAVERADREPVPLEQPDEDAASPRPRSARRQARARPCRGPTASSDGRRGRRRPAAPAPRAGRRAGSAEQALPQEVAEPALHAVALHRVADRLAHDEPTRGSDLRVGATSREHVHDQERPRRVARDGWRGELAGGQPLGRASNGADRSQQAPEPRSLRPRAACVPCARRAERMARPARVRMRRRNPCVLRDDGCSAGTYACSRAISPGRRCWDAVVAGVLARVRSGEALRDRGTSRPGRPCNGTRSVGEGQTGADASSVVRTRATDTSQPVENSLPVGRRRLLASSLFRVLRLVPLPPSLVTSSLAGRRFRPPCLGDGVRGHAEVSEWFFTRPDPQCTTCG